MKSRVYTDTSVIGGVYDHEFKEWSERLITDFKDGLKTIVLSDLTLMELESAPTDVRNVIKEIPPENIEFISVNNEVLKLADIYLKEKIVTQKYIIDAQHIALAAIYGVDVVVSWNFRHIVNLDKIKQYNAINLKYGYNVVEIRSPREVVSDGTEIV